MLPPCPCRSNHKSVLGIGAYAKARGAALSCVDEAGMAAWLSGPNSYSPHDATEHPPARAALQSTQLTSPATAAAAAAHNVTSATTFSLVAYPSKDNYEGRLYPLDWVEQVILRHWSWHDGVFWVHMGGCQPQ